MSRFLAKFSEKTAQFHRLSLRRNGKQANLRLWADSQDAPLPQPFFMGTQSQGKKAGLAVAGAVSLRKPV
jgi:hypothetical protein